MRQADETTRAHAAEYFGASVATILQLEREQKIRVRRDGRHVYLNFEDVKRARSEWRPQRARKVKNKGDTIHLLRARIAVQCFPEFAAGTPLVDIVQKHCVDPMLVRQLYEEWKVSLDEGVVRRAAEQEQKRQDRLQRQHENRLRLEKWQRWKLELARIEARGGRREDAGPEPPRGSK